MSWYQSSSAGQSSFENDKELGERLERKTDRKAKFFWCYIIELFESTVDSRNLESM